MIYKLFPAEAWAAARGAEHYAGSGSDLADGFIHLSTAAQAPETAAKHFPREPGLVLAEVNEAALGPALKWEPSRGGALFPHLHAELPLSAIGRTWVLPVGASGLHEFPPGFGKTGV